MGPSPSQAQAHPLTPIPIPIPPTEDASTLIYRKGESRCILIASGLGPRAHMYAHLKPCDSKVCDLLEHACRKVACSNQCASLFCSKQVGC